VVFCCGAPIMLCVGVGLGLCLWVGVVYCPSQQYRSTLHFLGLACCEGAESWCLSVTFQLKAQAIAAGVSARQAWLGARALDALHVPTVQAFMQNKHPPVPCLRPGGGGGGLRETRVHAPEIAQKSFPLTKKIFPLEAFLTGLLYAPTPAVTCQPALVEHQLPSGKPVGDPKLPQNLRP